LTHVRGESQNDINCYRTRRRGPSIRLSTSTDLVPRVPSSHSNPNRSLSLPLSHPPSPRRDTLACGVGIETPDAVMRASSRPHLQRLASHRAAHSYRQLGSPSLQQPSGSSASLIYSPNSNDRVSGSPKGSSKRSRRPRESSGRKGSSGSIGRLRKESRVEGAGNRV
jgi:hypothetical protein